MTALPAPLNPLGQFLNLIGKGTTLGHLWIGDENTDPEEVPKAVFWDALGTVPATQPLDLNAGYVWRDGAPAQWFTEGPFSIRLRDKPISGDDPSTGSLIFYLPSVSNATDTVQSGPWPFPMALTQPTDTSPTASQWMGGIDVRWAMQLPADLGGPTPVAGSAGGWAFTAPSGGSFVMTLRLNSTDEDAATGTAIATMTWADGSNTPVLATTGNVTIDLPAGSRLDWYASATSHSINGLYWTWIGYVQADGSGAFANLVTEGELQAAVDELQTQIDNLTTTISGIEGFRVGDLKLFTGAAADLPANWIALDTDAVAVLSIASYPVLGALLLATWGGDGVTTFGVPPGKRYFRAAGSGLTVGTLLGFATETHNHANGVQTTTGSTQPMTYGTTSTDAISGPHQTVHTDNNAPDVQGYTSAGSPIAGTGTGAPVGTFDTETRPVTAVVTVAVYAGAP